MYTRRGTIPARPSSCSRRTRWIACRLLIVLGESRFVPRGYPFGLAVATDVGYDHFQQTLLEWTTSEILW